MLLEPGHEFVDVAVALCSPPSTCVSSVSHSATTEVGLILFQKPQPIPDLRKPCHPKP